MAHFGKTRHPSAHTRGNTFFCFSTYCFQIPISFSLLLLVPPSRSSFSFLILPPFFVFQRIVTKPLLPPFSPSLSPSLSHFSLSSLRLPPPRFSLLLIAPYPSFSFLLLIPPSPSFFRFSTFYYQTPLSSFSFDTRVRLTGKKTALLIKTSYTHTCLTTTAPKTTKVFCQ